MMNSSETEKLGADVVSLVEAYNELYSLMFRNSRNLSDAGRGLIAELKRRGLKQKDAVRILGISPAAAYNNWHDVEEAA